MLRVEIRDSANSLSLKLEGRFTGDDAQNTRTLITRCREGMRLVVDLTDVTFIDPVGEEVLSFFGGFGTEFVAQTSYTLDLADDDGFAHSCVQGKELGFDGKTLIHPKTITKANEVFAPSPDEVARSRKIIAAHAEASRAGKGITVVDGKLIENLHVENAKRLVALADAITALQGMEPS